MQLPVRFDVVQWKGAQVVARSVLTSSGARSGLGWRRAAYWGARFGPGWWLRYSPACFGCLGYVLFSDARKRVQRNVRVVSGRRNQLLEARAVVATFINYAHCLAESLAAGRAESDRARITVTGEEHLARFSGEGRGVVVVTAHLGAWDVAARLLGRDTHKTVTAVMAPEQGAAAQALQDTLRAKSGVRIHHRGGDPLKSFELLRTLRAGGVVAIQLDRAPARTRAIAASCFGKSVSVPVGPFLLASVAGVPVLPVFVARDGFFSYSAVVEPPIELPRRPDESELREAVQRATSAMESFIRRHPTQWFHFSDR